LCDRFKKLPSEVMAEDAGVIRLLHIQSLGNPEQEAGGDA
jgi:hypothetical protein